MKALLIVESWFGNTRLIAGAVADGAAEAGAQVEMVDVDAAPRVVPEDVDLLMLGAPTHNLGLSTVATRRKALAAGASPGNTGIREWLNDATLRSGILLAAFDTNTGHGRLSGSAARSIARMLARRGLGRSCVTLGFVVQGAQGPLNAAETERAREWGRTLTHSQPHQ